MNFIIIALAIISSSLCVNAYHKIKKPLPQQPAWLYRLNYASIIATSYIIIEAFNVAAFLTIAVIATLITKGVTSLMSHKGKSPSKDSVMVELSHDVWLFLLVLWAIRTFAYDYSPIPSGSMEPTLYAGDVIAINKLSYQVKIPPLENPLFTFNTPKPGDVVVLNSPINPQDFYIKRIIAGPGDHVLYKNKQYFVNGKLYEQTNKSFDTSVNNDKPMLLTADEKIGNVTHKIQLDNRQFDDIISIEVPEGHYFISGDNRDFSLDSRTFGPIPEKLIVGKATHLITQLTLPTLLSFKRSGTIY
ncbi:signal peptidase I [Candidatus Synchoanobacter obligatus]|uniref:Signal peptidase I n=1 Tax=Candidatus Synchoanobacter obligatus TaxID=2919597 RepID=A0ABT1L4M5_9GAMM|nr:signal peptidase I [Candidatus Synchoanobacter obligatus]MCP8352130.1 signal peptidase I [Candidatus Synchoanobacter obligatus]